MYTRFDKAVGTHRFVMDIRETCFTLTRIGFDLKF